MIAEKRKLFVSFLFFQVMQPCQHASDSDTKHMWSMYYRQPRCVSTATKLKTASRLPSTTQTPTRPAPSLLAQWCIRY